MTTAEIRPFVGQKCTLKYGETGKILGSILRVDKDRVQIKGQYGEYSVPLDQVTSVDPQ